MKTKKKPKSPPVLGVPGYLTSSQAARILNRSIQHVRRIRDRLGAVQVTGSGVYLYPEARVREVAAQPRVYRGWPKGKKRK